MSHSQPPSASARREVRRESPGPAPGPTPDPRGRASPGRKPSSILQIFMVTLALWAALAFAGSSASRASGFYADVGVHGQSGGQTVLLNRLPADHRRAVKREILALLGLHHRPRPGAHGRLDSAPSYMLSLYKSLNDDDVVHGVEGTSSSSRGPGSLPPVVRQRLVTHNLTLPGMEEKAGGADMIASFVSHGHRGHHRLRHERNRMLHFDFSEVPPEMGVTGAELRVYKHFIDSSSQGNKSVTIEIYKVYEDHNRMYEKAIILEANVTVSGSHNGWVDINVTSAASQWNYYPATNHGFYMVVKNQFGETVAPSVAGVVDRRGPDDKQAFLVVFFKAMQEVRSRRTRGAGRRSQKTEVTYADEPGQQGWGPNMNVRFSNRACQRRQLYVSFEDLGWQDWIIAPKGYSAFYCSGECSFPLNVHMNATNHAIVQTLVHLMHPFQAPKPSCAPTELSAISVLYFDDNSNVILKKYRNMVVTACGCH